VRRLFGALVLMFPNAAFAQGPCDGQPMRSTLQGAALGAGVMVGFIAIQDRDHRVSSSERLPYAWGITANSALFGAVARRITERRCPSPGIPVFPDSLRPCGGAAARGAGVGAALGGLTGFIAAPFGVLMFVVPVVLGGHHLNFGRVVGASTAAGAAIGAPIGAHRGYQACKG
jgi:hypothetical protein